MDRAAQTNSSSMIQISKDNLPKKRSCRTFTAVSASSIRQMIEYSITAGKNKLSIVIQILNIAPAETETRNLSAFTSTTSTISPQHTTSHHWKLTAWSITGQSRDKSTWTSWQPSPTKLQMHNTNHEYSHEATFFLTHAHLHAILCAFGWCILHCTLY